MLCTQPLSELRWSLGVERADRDTPAAFRDRAIDAVVPGCVHADLVRAGVIEHPDRGFAERDQQWIGRTDWRYETRFEADPAVMAAERADLVLARLDTIATVELNGVVAGRAASAHHPHRFDVGDLLTSVGNELVVRLEGPSRYVARQERRFGTRPYNGDWGAYSFIRKPACNFGWDWGPRVATAGMTGPVGLEAWSTARIVSVRPLVRTADVDHARLDVLIDLQWTKGPKPLIAHATLEGPDGDRLTTSAAVTPGQELCPLPLEIDRPALWWPRGYGEQSRYRLTVRLEREDAIVDDRSASIGLRTARLDRSPDTAGSRFAVEVNGRPVFCRGANWIPNDVFPAPVDHAAIRRRVEQAAAANMNMLRVWGGGAYEDEVFYQRCDELGLLVWQDFMFACATYPEDDPYPELVDAEARHQVARLCRHPSVVLWCGGNENIWAYESWGFGARLRPGQTWGRRYWREQLPAIVDELDPTRPYWPDSPWSGSDDRHPQDPDHGDRHTWELGIDAYRALVPRFASELGHQGPPNLATLRRALDEADLVIDSEAMRHRQRATGGNAKWYDGPLAEWFTPPRDFLGWHYLAQLLQARVVGEAIVWHRVNMPRCMGLLFWQLNDCWAGHSWSAIDADGRRKLLWYAARRAFADRLITIQPIGETLALCMVNDRDEPWSTVVIVRRTGFDGGVLAEERIDASLEPRTARTTPLRARVRTPGDPAGELIVAEPEVEETRRALWFFARDRELHYPAARLSTRVRREGDEDVLRLEAQTLLRDATLAADVVDPTAEVSEQLVTLLPGETFEFRVRTDTRIDEGMLRAAVRCVNS